MVGIVGHGADKFTPLTMKLACERIRVLLSPADAVLVSGHSPAGGIDIWAEEIAQEMGRPMVIHEAPIVAGQDRPYWSTGFKPRNIQIAEDSDVVHVLVVARYPSHYTGMRFEVCYHCRNRSHVKSGGCWTARYAKTLGKPAYWHIIGGNT